MLAILSALRLGSQVGQTLSKELRSQFAEYQASLRLKGLGGFGTLTARNLDEYLVEQYLEPSASQYLAPLSDADRTSYLAKNTFITWSGGKAAFSWADFLTHVGAREKTTPAFDAFDLSTCRPARTTSSASPRSPTRTAPSTGGSASAPTTPTRPTRSPPTSPPPPTGWGTR